MQLLAGFVVLAAFAVEATLPLPQLEYAYGDLAPIISEHAMEIHHLRHMQAYQDKANIALDTLRNGPPEWKRLAKQGIDSLLANLSAVPEENGLRTQLRNNGGGWVNHALYFRILRAPGTAPDHPTPGEPLDQALTEQFGSFQQFKEQFSRAASSMFGSGWTWLYFNRADGKLRVSNTANQDSPVMESRDNYAILTLDLWEHAYYLNFENRRADWIVEWWKIVNWAEVQAQLHIARSVPGQGAPKQDL